MPRKAIVRADAGADALSAGVSMPPAAPGAADDPLVLAVLEEFRLIFKTVRRHFQSVEAKAGVSGAQVWVLAQVAGQPDIRVTELARALAIHQTTASNLVDRLDSAGMLQRRRDPADQRVVRLRVTAAGRRALANAPGPAQGVLPAALKRLTRAELTELKQRLAKLARLLPLRDARGRKTPLSEM